MEWIQKLDGNVIVCDAEGIIIYMNEKALGNYMEPDGTTLIGRNIMDCHNEESKKKLHDIMENQQNNIYTIEKGGRKKIIYQSPWMDGDRCKGIIEISLEIPFEMLHFKRD